MNASIPFEGSLSLERGCGGALTSIEPRRRGPLPLLVTTLVTLVLTSTLPADEADRDGPIPPWLQAQILNKGAIAEDQMRRIQGLREAGNPHLKAGTILENAELGEPKLDEEARDALRARQVASYSTRQVDWSARPDREAVLRSERQDSDEPATTVGFGLAQVVALCSSMCLLLLLLRQRR